MMLKIFGEWGKDYYIVKGSVNWIKVYLSIWVVKGGIDGYFLVIVWLICY